MMPSSTRRCRHKPLIVDCQNCGKDLDPKKDGRARRYCSDKCRKAAQRKRQQGSQRHRDEIAEQKLETRQRAFPALVAKKLESIRCTYGVFAAWEASEAVILFVDPQRTYYP